MSLICVNPGYPCPSTHPFAFNNGSSCCESQRDKSGDTIKYDSISCNDDLAKPCLITPCMDNYGKWKHFTYQYYA